MTRMLTLSMLVLAAAGCNPDQELVEITTSFDGDVAVFSWEGGPMSSLSVAENDDATGEDLGGTVEWSIECGDGLDDTRAVDDTVPPNGNNCIESPVRYGEAPNGANTLTEAATLVGDQLYWVTGSGFENGGELPYFRGDGTFTVGSE